MASIAQSSNTKKNEQQQEQHSELINKTPATADTIDIKEDKIVTNLLSEWLKSVAHDEESALKKFESIVNRLHEVKCQSIGSNDVELLEEFKKYESQFEALESQESSDRNAAPSSVATAAAAKTRATATTDQTADKVVARAHCNNTSDNNNALLSKTTQKTRHNNQPLATSATPSTRQQIKTRPTSSIIQRRFSLSIGQDDAVTCEQQQELFYSLDPTTCLDGGASNESEATEMNQSMDTRQQQRPINNHCDAMDDGSSSHHDAIVVATNGEGVASTTAPTVMLTDNNNNNNSDNNNKSNADAVAVPQQQQQQQQQQHQQQTAGQQNGRSARQRNSQSYANHERELQHQQEPSEATGVNDAATRIMKTKIISRDKNCCRNQDEEQEEATCQPNEKTKNKNGAVHDKTANDHYNNDSISDASDATTTTSACCSINGAINDSKNNKQQQPSNNTLSISDNTTTTTIGGALVAGDNLAAETKATLTGDRVAKNGVAATQLRLTNASDQQHYAIARADVVSSRKVSQLFCAATCGDDHSTIIHDDAKRLDGGGKPATMDFADVSNNSMRTSDRVEHVQVHTHDQQQQQQLQQFFQANTNTPGISNNNGKHTNIMQQSQSDNNENELHMTTNKTELIQLDKANSILARATGIASAAANTSQSNKQTDNGAAAAAIATAYRRDREHDSESGQADMLDNMQTGQAGSNSSVQSISSGGSSDCSLERNDVGAISKLKPLTCSLQRHSGGTGNEQYGELAGEGCVSSTGAPSALSPSSSSRSVSPRSSSSSQYCSSFTSASSGATDYKDAKRADEPPEDNQKQADTMDADGNAINGQCKRAQTKQPEARSPAGKAARMSLARVVVPIKTGQDHPASQNRAGPVATPTKSILTRGVLQQQRSARNNNSLSLMSRSKSNLERTPANRLAEQAGAALVPPKAPVGIGRHNSSLVAPSAPSQSKSGAIGCSQIRPITRQCSFQGLRTSPAAHRLSLASDKTIGGSHTALNSLNSCNNLSVRSTSAIPKFVAASKRCPAKTLGQQLAQQPRQQQLPAISNVGPRKSLLSPVKSSSISCLSMLNNPAGIGADIGGGDVANAVSCPKPASHSQLTESVSMATISVAQSVNDACDSYAKLTRGTSEQIVARKEEPASLAPAAPACAVCPVWERRYQSLAKEKAQLNEQLNEIEEAENDARLLSQKLSKEVRNLESELKLVQTALSKQKQLESRLRFQNNRLQFQMSKGTNSRPSVAAIVAAPIEERKTVDDTGPDGDRQDSSPGNPADVAGNTGATQQPTSGSADNRCTGSRSTTSSDDDSAIDCSGSGAADQIAAGKAGPIFVKPAAQGGSAGSQAPSDDRSANNPALVGAHQTSSSDYHSDDNDLFHESLPMKSLCISSDSDNSGASDSDNSDDDDNDNDTDNKKSKQEPAEKSEADAAKMPLGDHSKRESASSASTAACSSTACSSGYSDADSFNSRESTTCSSPSSQASSGLAPASDSGNSLAASANDASAAAATKLGPTGENEPQIDPVSEAGGDALVATKAKFEMAPNEQQTQNEVSLTLPANSSTATPTTTTTTTATVAAVASQDDQLTHAANSLTCASSPLQTTDTEPVPRDRPQLPPRRFAAHRQQQQQLAVQRVKECDNDGAKLQQQAIGVTSIRINGQQQQQAAVDSGVKLTNNCPSEATSSTVEQPVCRLMVKRDDRASNRSQSMERRAMQGVEYLERARVPAYLLADSAGQHQQFPLFTDLACHNGGASTTTNNSISNSSSTNSTNNSNNNQQQQTGDSRASNGANDNPMMSTIVVKPQPESTLQLVKQQQMEINNLKLRLLQTQSLNDNLVNELNLSKDNLNRVNMIIEQQQQQFNQQQQQQQSTYHHQSRQLASPSIVVVGGGGPNNPKHHYANNNSGQLISGASLINYDTQVAQQAAFQCPAGQQHHYSARGCVTSAPYPAPSSHLQPGMPNQTHLQQSSTCNSSYQHYLPKQNYCADANSNKIVIASTCLEFLESLLMKIKTHHNKTFEMVCEYQKLLVNILERMNDLEEKQDYFVRIKLNCHMSLQHQHSSSSSSSICSGSTITSNSINKSVQQQQFIQQLQQDANNKYSHCDVAQKLQMNKYLNSQECPIRPPPRQRHRLQQQHLMGDLGKQHTVSQVLIVPTPTTADLASQTMTNGSNTNKNKRPLSTTLVRLNGTQQYQQQLNSQQQAIPIARTSSCIMINHEPARSSSSVNPNLSSSTSSQMVSHIQVQSSKLDSDAISSDYYRRGDHQISRPQSMIICSSSQQNQQQLDNNNVSVDQFKSRHEQLMSFIRFERNKIKEFQARYQSQLIDLLSRQNWFENLLNERINLNRGTNLKSGAKYTYCSSTINVVSQQQQLQQQPQQYGQVPTMHHYQPIPYKSTNYSSSCQSITNQGNDTTNKQQMIKYNNKSNSTPITVGDRSHR